MKQRRPWVITAAGPREWPSHNQIFSALTRVLEALPCEVVELWPPRPVAPQSLVRDLRASASSLIVIPPLHIGVPLVADLRRRHGITIPCVFVETAHMCMGGRVFLQEHESLKNSDHFVGPSSASTRLMQESFLNNTNVHRVPFPVFQEEMSPLSARERQGFREGLGLKKEEKFLVYAGRLTPQKNIHSLLYVFAEVLKSRPKTKLFVIGGFEDDYSPSSGFLSKAKYQERIWQIIDELDLARAVRFVGFLPRTKLRSYLASCDAQISLTTYFSEEFGYGIAEGLACGAPTIVTQWGGGLDFVGDGGAMGVRVSTTQNGPQIDFSLAVQNILNILNPKTNALWRTNALRFAKRHLFPQAVSKKWQRIIESAEDFDVASSTLQWTTLPKENFLDFSVQVADTRPSAGEWYFKAIYSSPSHPFMKWVSRAYAGEAETQKHLAKYSLNPLFSITKGVLDDHSAHRQQLVLSAPERRLLTALNKKKCLQRSTANDKYIRSLVEKRILIETYKS